MTADARGTARAALTVLLAGTLLLSLSGVVYLGFLTEHANEPYTELSLLGPDGQATGYPTDLAVGETGEVVVVVANNRPRPAAFSLVVGFGARTTTRQITVPARGRWKTTVRLTPTRAGRRPLHVRLYRGRTVDPDARPYRGVRLWIDVADGAARADVGARPAKR